ncbi:hypothetical protein HPB47_014274 [Ixodes persulcatus]|uniref:Uncharacterized protein n=1 Tax=Ixodes persulcatus TaxID=34615 RepID=A0AC60QWP4_IXOPE|nr:hypothetical protein HPB47_014274 [Ixodes persulcatus]
MEPNNAGNPASTDHARESQVESLGSVAPPHITAPHYREIEGEKSGRRGCPLGAFTENEAQTLNKGGVMWGVLSTEPLLFSSAFHS